MWLVECGSMRRGVLEYDCQSFCMGSFSILKYFVVGIFLLWSTLEKHPPSCISLHRPTVPSLYTITAHNKTVVLKVLEPKNPLESILVLDQTPDREHHTIDI